tara:strand:- start:930 stop:1652 length:723 start_codon:yes stop_codon:yes gene_type:complete
MIAYLFITFVLGVLLFFAPTLIIDRLDIEKRVKIAQFYFGLATRFYDRMMFLQRKHGSLTVYPSAFDGQLQSEYIQLSKKSKAHFEDVYGCIGYWNQKPILFADERTNCLFNPPLADIGTHFKDMVQNERHTHVFDARMENSFKAYCSYLAIDNTPSLVNLRDWVALVSGSATPFLCEMTDEFVRLSQQKYHSNKSVEAMVALTFFGIGFGAVGGMLYLTKSQYTQQIQEIIPLVIGGLL